MKPSVCHRLVVQPVVCWLEGYGLPAGVEVERLLVAVALQESGCVARHQANGGPARGLWQFERAGLVGVLNHRRSRVVAGEVAEVLGFGVRDVEALHEALAVNDQLACAFARLLVFTDAAPLPEDGPNGWLVYERLWRPGKPRPIAWADAWAASAVALASNDNRLIGGDNPTLLHVPRNRKS